MTLTRSFVEMPAHSANAIKWIAILTACVLVSIVGVAFGAPQALWVWLIPFFYEGGQKCRCHDCRGEPNPEEREEAAEIVARQYAEGRIDESELDHKLDRIEDIHSTDPDRAEELLEPETR